MIQRPLQGFTTIELVVTIVIVAILSAVALPRFINVSGSAHRASVDATAGAIQSAVAMAHAVWRIYGDGNEVADLAQYADGSYNFNEFGYPFESRDDKSPGNDDVGPQYPNDNMCGRVWNGLLDHSPPLDISGVGNRDGDSHRNYASIEDGDYAVQTTLDRRCEYLYLPDPTLRIVYDTAAGSVTVATN